MALRTIETDPISPFCEPEVPAAEWTYRHWLEHAFSSGPAFVRAYLSEASRRAGRGFMTVPEFPTGRSLSRSVVARVDHGRWLWDCPICHAAQVCSVDDPRAFCIECFNVGDGWWPVEWPDPALVEAAEVVLENRPQLASQNWNPAQEELRDLQNENLAHGVDPDAPGYELVGNPDVMLGLREELRKLGYPIIDDDRLMLPSSPALRELFSEMPVTLADAQEAVEMRALEAAKDK